MRHMLIIGFALITGGIHAGDTNSNYISTSAYGLTFRHPSNIAIMKPVVDDGVDVKMDTIQLRSTNIFNAMFYIYRHSPGAEKLANEMMTTLVKINSANARSNSVLCTILGSERQGVVFKPIEESINISSELFLFKEAGECLLLYLVFAHSQDEDLCNNILTSMQWSIPYGAKTHTEKKCDRD